MRLSTLNSFGFTKIWIRDSSSHDVVWSSWNEIILGSSLFQLSEKLRITKQTQILEQSLLRGIAGQDKNLYAFYIQSQPLTEAQCTQEFLVQAELNELLLGETILLKEKARVKWLHHLTIVHRRSNALY